MSVERGYIFPLFVVANVKHFWKSYEFSRVKTWRYFTILGHQTSGKAWQWLQQVAEIYSHIPKIYFR